MHRLLALALLVAAAITAAGCGTSACQDLGEKVCRCQPGMTEDTCKTQVEDQLNGLGVNTPGLSGILDNVETGQPLTFEDYCQQRLDGTASVPACAAPEGVDFCEWLLTEAGKDACGLTPANPSPP